VDIGFPVPYGERSRFHVRRLSWAVAITLLSACAHRGVRGTPNPEVKIPPGLDSTQTSAWIARQRAACHGRLVTLTDYGPFAVQCFPGLSAAEHPPNEAVEKP